MAGEAPALSVKDVEHRWTSCRRAPKSSLWQESSEDPNCPSSQVTQNAYGKWPTDSKNDQEQMGWGENLPGRFWNRALPEGGQTHGGACVARQQTLWALGTDLGSGLAQPRPSSVILNLLFNHSGPDLHSCGRTPLRAVVRINETMDVQSIPQTPPL